MVRVTCLSPTKSYSYWSSAFAHLEFLIFNLRTTIFYSEQSTSNHTKQTTSTTKNNTPIQKKGFKKSVLKDKARCYDYESARNAENGTNVEKIQ